MELQIFTNFDNQFETREPIINVINVGIIFHKCSVFFTDKSSILNTFVCVAQFSNISYNAFHDKSSTKLLVL